MFLLIASILLALIAIAAFDFIWSIVSWIFEYVLKFAIFFAIVYIILNIVF